MNRDRLKQCILDFFDDAKTLSLATVDDEGLPHACNVNFVFDENLKLYFVSNAKSAHSQHLMVRPNVAACVYTPFTMPREIKGVQIKGLCTVEPKERFDEIWRLFRQRVPDAEKFELIAKMEQMICFTPNWVRWIDNSERFGYKVEMDWE